MNDMGGSEFARKCDVSEGAIRKYLNGTQPRMDALVKIAMANDASIEWLATGRGVPYEPQRIIDINADTARLLDMKEQYVRAIFYRLEAVQDDLGLDLHPDALWYAISMINQVMIRELGGRDATDEEMEPILADFVDTQFRQAHGKKGR